MPEYIDREALLEDINAAVKNSGMGYVIGKTLKRYVKLQTAADVAPVRHGYVTTTIDEWETMHQSCSECREELGWKEYPNYCPNCGARLDLEEDGNA